MKQRIGKRKTAVIVFMLLCLPMLAQKKMQYRRSSICPFYFGITVTNSELEKIAIQACEQYHLSDKYNTHYVGERILRGKEFDKSQNQAVTRSQQSAYGRQSNMGRRQPMSRLETMQQQSAQRANRIEAYRQRIEEKEQQLENLKRYLEDHHIANQLIAKWFNMSTTRIGDSFFNMELIQERGAYNATELERLRAKESVRGMGILKDAGMDLISNTYVTFTTINYENGDERFERMNKSFQEAGKRMTINGKPVDIDLHGTESEFYAREHTTFNVKVEIYLFKLVWNERIENYFINKYYNCKDTRAFLTDKFFTMTFLGSEVSKCYMSENTGMDASAYNRAQITGQRLENYKAYLPLATIVALDNAYAKLQKKNEDFCVKAPLADVEDGKITAFIGLKEGINKKSKFEVLEKIYNEKDNTFRYKKVSTLTVEKDKVWDNRFTDLGVLSNGENNYVVNLIKNGKQITISDDQGKIKIGDASIDRTYLKGSIRNLAPGMLIRQTK